MEELVKAVAAKTGLPIAVAQTAVLVVISHIKGMLPKMLADQIDTYLGTGTHDPSKAAPHSGGAMDSVMKGLGGILGKK